MTPTVTTLRHSQSSMRLVQTAPIMTEVNQSPALCVHSVL